MPTSNHLEKCRKFAFFIFIKFLGSALEFGIWNLEFGIWNLELYSKSFTLNQYESKKRSEKVS